MCLINVHSKIIGILEYENTIAMMGSVSFVNIFFGTLQILELCIDVCENTIAMMGSVSFALDASVLVKIPLLLCIISSILCKFFFNLVNQINCLRS